MPALSLTLRTFLFSFLPLCAVVSFYFFNIRSGIERNIREGLKASLHRSQLAWEDADDNYKRRNSRWATVLGENAALKASLGLAREGAGADTRSIDGSVEASLGKIASGLDYDLVALTDSAGRVLGALAGKDRLPIVIPSLPTLPSAAWVLEVGGTLYEATTVPVNMASENVGSLTVATKFRMDSFDRRSYLALVGKDRVLLSTLPQKAGDALGVLLKTGWKGEANGREVKLGDENYLAASVKRATMGTAYQLLSFQSVDSALAVFTEDFGFIFLKASLVGVILTLLVGGIASISTAKPISELTASLARNELSGSIRKNLQTTSFVKEVNVLARAINRAEQSAQDSRETLSEAYLQFVRTMAQALDARDPYTAGHSNRVSEYSVGIARQMGLSEEAIETIRIGALLHDIGKIGIPDAVLQKPGKLTYQEFELIKLHPQIGKRILEQVGKFQEYLPIVELHHENHDGSGYPYKLAGEAIPLGARIVHQADAYDAMTSDRSYRNAMPMQEVLEILREAAGSQFDPEVTRAFLSFVETQDIGMSLNHLRALANA